MKSEFLKPITRARRRLAGGHLHGNTSVRRPVTSPSPRPSPSGRGGAVDSLSPTRKCQVVESLPKGELRALNLTVTRYAYLAGGISAVRLLTSAATIFAATLFTFSA